ncbi:hypothetical protein TSUD_368470 [Trifolium subterraneum]|uniref:Uncharacterized protein n=1 Tax=Trifolium subterraneum TaxID=3900 RepID=A0A2Z6LMD0_TRISU|nr:hypothetical protein TSUD_368470 [Trifolium subterraneum]
MMMNPVFVRRGLNAAAGFIVPGSMVDNTFVLDSFVAAAANNTPRRRPQNNNNSNLFSSQVATRRDVGLAKLFAQDWKGDVTVAMHVSLAPV